MKTFKTVLPVAITMILGFTIADLIALQVQTNISQGIETSQIISSVSDALCWPWKIGYDRISLLAGLAGSLTVGLAWLYRWSGRRTMRDGEEYGSACWAKPDDMAAFTDKDPRHNLQMTLSEGLSIDTQSTKRNLNTLVIGSSGSGKTITHVIPNLNNANMNYACTDPKGELYDKTHSSLEQHGYLVRKLDLVNLICDTQFNPLAYIDTDKPDVAIMRLVTNIMQNTNGEKKTGSTDGFWEKAERSLLTALVALVYYLPGDILQSEGLGVRSGKTLNAVADLAARMEASEEDENRLSPVDVLVHTCEQMADEAREIWETTPPDERDDNLAEMWKLANGLRFAATQYRPFTQGAGETKKSVVISLGVRLAPIQVGALSAILENDNIGINDIGSWDASGRPSRPVAIFLALPDEDPTFNFIAAIFYQCLFDNVIQRCRTYPGQRLARPLHCFLDEFANIGRIPNFEHLIATIRSRAVSVSIILQTVAQLKTMYKDAWETIAGNCDSTLFLGGNEQSTTEWMAKRLGKQTIDTRTTSQSKGASGSWTVNHNRTGRDLLTADELGHLDNDKCIYMLRGVHPFLSRKLWPGKHVKRPHSTLVHTTT